MAEPTIQDVLDAIGRLEGRMERLETLSSERHESVMRELGNLVSSGALND